MSQFTGERVIPGQVNDDLWAEHVSRYAMATRFARDRHVLDLGCGTGYGTADLAATATAAVGIDVSRDAITYALRHYPSARFLQASATCLPFAAASFNLVTAFEVIEHLRDWRALLTEARRVLDEHGLLIVSTPNTRYYAESRAQSGPNPFHEHEFEFDEFRAVLVEHFPYVQILFQDRIEAFAFYGTGETRTEADLARPSADPESANFFIGICSGAPLPQLPSFLYAPRAANLLREREHHIRLLEQELTHVRTWLEQTISDRNNVQQQLESEQARALQIITDLNAEIRKQSEWGKDLDRRLAGEIEQRTEAARLLDIAEATVIERTDWARRLDAQLQETLAQLEMVRQSRWLRLGRQLGLGPQLKEATARTATTKEAM